MESSDTSREVTDTVEQPQEVTQEVKTKDVNDEVVGEQEEPSPSDDKKESNDDKPTMESELNLDDSTDSDDDEHAALSADDLVGLISSFKAQGNESLKQSAWEPARKAYNEALAIEKKLSIRSESSAFDARVKGAELRLSILSNLSLVGLKSENWNMAITNATQVLSLDATNTKALYRRAQANAKIASTKADLNAAKSSVKDLSTCIKLDPKNKSAKILLKRASVIMKKLKTKERKKYAGMFSGGLSMYADREEERKEKERLKKEAEEKLRDEWRQENERRTKACEETITFEDWDKARQEKVKKEKEAKEKEEKERREKEREMKRKSQKNSKYELDADDDDIKGLMKGYKKKSDGRTTSYFDTERSARDLELIGDVTPQKLNTNASQSSNGDCSTSSSSSSTTTTVTDQPTLIKTIKQTTELSREGSSAGSAWNNAGTFEERNLTTWATAEMKSTVKGLEWKQEGINTSNPTSFLSSITSMLGGGSGGAPSTENLEKLTMAAYGVDIKVDEVTSCEGTATSLFARGKRKAFFEFNVGIKFHVSITDFAPASGLGMDMMNNAESTPGKTHEYKGSITIIDLSNQNGKIEYEERTVKWDSKKRPQKAHNAIVKKSVNELLDNQLLKVVSDTFMPKFLAK